MQTLRYAQLLRFIRPRRNLLAVVLLLLLVVTASNLANPLSAGELSELLLNGTVILITHRPARLGLADRLIQFTAAGKEYSC